MLKFSSKFLEKKDIIDIAIVGKIFGNSQLWKLISFVFKGYKKKGELIYPLSLYKIFILYEDFSIFHYLISQEISMASQDLLTLNKYSIFCSSTIFSIYFGKVFNHKLDRFKPDIIQALLSSIDSANSNLQGRAKTHKFSKWWNYYYN